MEDNKDLSTIQALSYYYNQDFKKIKNFRPLVLTRSPLVAPHNAGILYSGETYVSWDTLKFLPFYNSMASNKGIAFALKDMMEFARVKKFDWGLSVDQDTVLKSNLVDKYKMFTMIH